MADWLTSMLGALAQSGQGNPQQQDLEDIWPTNRAVMDQGLTGAYNAAMGPIASTIGGVGDLAELAMNVHAGARGGEFSELPISTRSVGRALGADPDSKAFQTTELFGADPFGKVASLAGIGTMAARRGMRESDDLVDQLEKITRERKVLKDYENDVSFVEMDTADPSVDARIKTTGQYRGAPRGIDRPQKLGKMRRNLWSLLDEGSEGRDWYEQSARKASQLTGDRPNYKHLYAGANAITSRGAAVPANRVFGTRGYNQAILNRQVDAGRFPTSQGAAIEELASGRTYYGGPKETPFYEGLTIDERAKGIRPTNDLWMARAFEFTKPDGSIWSEGLGKAQHRFMDNEISHIAKKANEAELGGHDDWTAEKVQAAIWVAVKARHEGTTVGKAAEDFSHGLGDLTGNVRYEAYPSTSLDHMQGIGQTDEYADIAERLLTDDQGRNRIALEMGALTEPGDRGYGIYEGATSPSMSARMLMAPSTGSSALDPASLDLAKGVGAGHGLVLGQDTVGITNFRPAKNAAERNIARVSIGQQDQSGMEALEEALQGTNAFPLHTPEGVEVAYMGNDGAQFTKDMKRIFGGENVEMGRNTGELIGNLDWDSPGYKPSQWMREIDESNLGPAEGRLEGIVQDMARAFDQTDQALEKAIPDAGQRDQVLTLTREILQSEGFAGIRKAVEQGILPVIVLTTLGTSMGGEEGNGAY